MSAFYTRKEGKDRSMKETNLEEFIEAVNLEIDKQIAQIEEQAEQKRKELIEKFKLNQDYTYFCMNDSSLTGFISSGKFYAFNKGLICHDTVFEETQVLHYLDINGINFDELNPLHIQIMRMYNI